MGCCKSSQLERLPSQQQDVDPPSVPSNTQVKIRVASFVRVNRSRITTVYELTQKLGDGAYGVVHKAAHLATGEQRAVKTIRKRKLQKQQALKMLDEVEILKQLDHPNIIKVLEVFESNKSYHIVTELCTGGELFDRIIASKHFTENLAAYYMHQIISAVAYCHERGIVHRDLKPENLLLENDSPEAMLKVIDFGTSCRMNPALPFSSITGTPYYIAPEVLLGKYNEKCDVWSCGVILFILLCGSPPFPGRSDREILDKVSAGLFSFESKYHVEPEWRQVSEGGKQLVRKMLTMNPAQRVSIREVLNDLWLTSRANSHLQDKTLGGRVLDNMQNFRGQCKLRQATFQFIACQLLSLQETRELRQIFMQLDENHDGKLSREELEHGYHLLDATAVKNMEKIMLDCDSDGSGFIDYSEFLTACIDWNSSLNEHRLQAAFRAYDTDNSGTISAKEIKALLQCEDKVDDEVWEEVLRDADTDGDGLIDLKEFKDMMTRKRQ